MTEDQENPNQIVVGLGFGDESKGSITDYLSRVYNADNVVRFSGGAQAAHAVVRPDGSHHVFAQFGSGFFNGATTLLSEYMMVSLFNLVPEADHLMELTGIDPFTKLHISESALLTTPIHEAANRARERARGAAAHGSCGLGIGETKGYSLKHPLLAPKVHDLAGFGTLGVKLDALRANLEAELGPLDAPSTEDILAGYNQLFQDRPLSIVSDHFIHDEIANGVNIFEGSQGTLLDEWHGFHPHTTWSTVTAKYAQRLISQAGMEPGKVIGVTRSYTTRHGHGPFPTEFTSPEAQARFPEKHNAWGEFQGGWRVGDLDLVLLNYAARINNVDEVAVTHLDSDYKAVATSYEGISYLDVVNGPDTKDQRANQVQLTEKVKNAKPNLFPVEDEEALLGIISGVTMAPVTIRSYGPTWKDKKFVPAD